MRGKLKGEKVEKLEGMMYTPGVHKSVHPGGVH